jgi:hypothetical protein
MATVIEHIDDADHEHARHSPWPAQAEVGESQRVAEEEGQADEQDDFLLVHDDSTTNNGLDAGRLLLLLRPSATTHQAPSLFVWAQ